MEPEQLEQLTIKTVLKKQKDDVQQVIKEEIIKSLFATSLADGVKMIIEYALMVILAHIAISASLAVVVVVGIVLAFLYRRVRKHVSKR